MSEASVEAHKPRTKFLVGAKMFPTISSEVGNSALPTFELPRTRTKLLHVQASATMLYQYTIIFLSKV